MFGWQGEERSQHGWDSEKNNLDIIQLAAEVRFSTGERQGESQM